MPKSSCASMTSRPLFISVELSMVILGPIDQVGWASASCTVAVPSLSAGQSRKGPPDAVSSKRATSVVPCTEARHWCSAQCSESTGTISAPGVLRAFCTTGAPAMRDSLLAKARRRPASSAAIVTGSPAKPTTALSTTSAPCAAATMPSSPTNTSMPPGTPSRTAAWRAGSPMTTTSGWNSVAWATSTSAERCAASAWTRKRCGSARMTSRACVPTEPEEPIRLTERIGSAEVKRFDHEVRGGQDEEEAVEAIEDAPVPGQQPAHVLEAEVPLDHRLAQVTERRHDGDDNAVEQRLAHGPRVDEVDHDDGHQDRGESATDQTLPALVGADGRGERVFADGRADEQRGHVVGHRDDHCGEDEGDAVTVGEQVRVEQQRSEGTEGAHPHEDEDRREHARGGIGRGLHAGEVPDERTRDEEHEDERQCRDPFVVGLDHQRQHRDQAEQ